MKREELQQMRMEREDVGVGSFIMMDTMPMKKVLKIIFVLGQTLKSITRFKKWQTGCKTLQEI